MTQLGFIMASCTTVETVIKRLDILTLLVSATRQQQGEVHCGNRSVAIKTGGLTPVSLT